MMVNKKNKQTERRNYVICWGNSVCGCLFVSVFLISVFTVHILLQTVLMFPASFYHCSMKKTTTKNRWTFYNHTCPKAGIPNTSSPMHKNLDIFAVMCFRFIICLSPSSESKAQKRRRVPQHCFMSMRIPNTCLYHQCFSSSHFHVRNPVQLYGLRFLRSSFLHQGSSLY